MAGRLLGLLAADGRDDVRRAQDAAVGDRGVARRHLHRRDRDALADRQVAHRRARVVLQRQHESLLLAGQVDAGRLAEAPLWIQASNGAVLSLWAISTAPMFEEYLEDVADRPRLIAVGLGVLDLAVGDLEDRREVEHRVRRDLAVLQRCGDRERLEGRARLVGGADRAVLARVRRAPRRARWRSPRGQLASARIAPLLGSMTIAVAPLGFHVLPTSLSTCSARSWMLASSVRRTLWPGRTGLVSRISIGSPIASLTSLRSPSVPVSCLSSEYSSPPRPWSSVPDAAEQLRRRPVARVVALVARDELQAGDLELLDLVGVGGRDAAAEVDEAGALGELAQQHVLAAADQRGELGRGLGHVLASGTGSRRCRSRARRPRGRCR